jgi:uncharacterized Ntn-hydrolase superfamily protein
MTFSLAGRCERTGMIGGIVCSSSIAVPARCLWASHVGVVLSQNVTDPYLGILGLQLLNEGHRAVKVLERIVAARANAEWRQLAVLDIDGRGETYTGLKGLGITCEARGLDCVAVGNLLANDRVPSVMVRAFEVTATTSLADRLLLAVETGAATGGEAGPVHSAGLQVYQGPTEWPIVDLRIDWSDAPIAELRGLWKLYAPQMIDYVLRATHPERAPSYGVPGDL